MDERVAGLPTGEVTFLLTDIEGSTRAWQQAPQRMTELVSVHYRLLDEAIDRHGGQRPQEQGEGDSVVAVFPQASDAVAAAVDAQRTLRRELPHLPVRMAVHTGEAMLRNADNYVGLTIIRCARIRGAAHGGQILVSDDAVGAVDGLPEIGALDLGRFGLRGLSGRERIWQLTHPELPATFPPLKAGSSAAGNLPVPVTSFVGRRRELAEVTELLGEHRVVSLVGGPGIGTSRLTLAAADACANSLAGGVWWVSLDDVIRDDVDALAAVIARACSVDTTGATPNQRIVEHFAGLADSLLVLDAIDETPTGVAALTEQLTAHCADVRVATTGRRPVDVAGVVTYDVGPLGLPPTGVEEIHLHDHDATRLFVERAAATAGTMIGTRDAPDVVRICRGLEGRPLAIELAAAQTRSTSLADLAAGIATFGSDAGVRRDLDAVVTSSIGWAYRLLDDGAQRALRAHAVFRGEVELDAIAAVLDAPADNPAVADAVRRLLDQQLLTFDDERERLGASPTIRAFAEARLDDTDERPLLVRRHAEWFTELVERFAAGGAPLPVSLLAADEADIVGTADRLLDGTVDDVDLTYRLLGAMAPILGELGRRDLADRAARWVAGRPPSDGEHRWSRTIALLSSVVDDPAHPAHRCRDEARAIAEIAGDLATVELFERAPSR